VRALGPRHWLAEGGYDAAKNVRATAMVHILPRPLRA
jgi:hypothetical protein